MSKRSRNKKAVVSHAKTNSSVKSDRPFVLKIFNKPLFNFILIAALGIIIYSNTLKSPFLWDDIKLILNNTNIRNLSNFTDFSGTRYLTYLSFALNYKINGYDVTGYHVFNIAVHIINAILVYLLMIMILKTPRFKESRIAQLSSVLALFSGLLFVSHPVHTMAVTNINQRSVPLATLFYLLSIIAFIKARLSSGNFLSGKHLPFYALSVISAVFAMKCKEISFTLPIVILIFDRYFFGKQWCFKKSVIYLIPILLTLLIIPLSKPQADVFNQQDSTSFKIEDSSVLSGLDAQKLSNIPRKVYMLTELRVILTYMRLFFLPVDLNFIYDYPQYESFLNSEVLLSFLFLLMMLALAIYIFIKARATDNGHNLLISFGIIWFVINLSLESFGVVLNYVIFEYRLYLPAIGFILALVASIGNIMAQESKMLRGLCLYIFFAVVITFSVATYNRNAVFKNEITFWEDVVIKSPAIVVAHNDLGIAYSKSGRFDEAIEQYKAALHLNPDYAKAYNNLGNVYSRTGRISEAIEEYKSALKINPDYVDAHNNLGNVYDKTGRINEAIAEYKTALRLNPNYAKAHKNLGNTYAKGGLLREAIESYEAALKLNPHDAEMHNNLALIYYNSGLSDKAIDHMQLAIKLNPDYINAHFNLGLIYLKSGLTTEARKEFEAVLRIDPKDDQARKALSLVPKSKDQQ